MELYNRHYVSRRGHILRLCFQGILNNQLSDYTETKLIQKIKYVNDVILFYNNVTLFI